MHENGGFSSSLQILAVIYFFKMFRVFIVVFDMDHFYSLYWICYNIASVLCFVFWLWGIAVLESTTPVLEGEVLTTGLIGKSFDCYF